MGHADKESQPEVLQQQYIFWSKKPTRAKYKRARSANSLDAATGFVVAMIRQRARQCTRFGNRKRSDNGLTIWTPKRLSAWRHCDQAHGASFRVLGRRARANYRSKGNRQALWTATELVWCWPRSDNERRCGRILRHQKRRSDMDNSLYNLHHLAM